MTLLYKDSRLNKHRYGGFLTKLNSFCFYQLSDVDVGLAV